MSAGGFAQKPQDALGLSQMSKDTPLPSGNTRKHPLARILTRQEHITAWENIDSIARLKKMSQNKVAKTTGMSPGQMSKLRSGSKAMTLAHLVQIAEGLGYDSRRLLP